MTRAHQKRRPGPTLVAIVLEASTIGLSACGAGRTVGLDPSAAPTISDAPSTHSAARAVGVDTTTYDNLVLTCEQDLLDRSGTVRALAITREGKKSFRCAGRVSYPTTPPSSDSFAYRLSLLSDGSVERSPE